MYESTIGSGTVNDIDWPALASTHFKHWGGGSSLFLSPSLFPLIVPPSFPPFLFPFHLTQLGDLGSAVSSPSGSGQSRTTKRVLVHLEVNNEAFQRTDFMNLQVLHRPVLRQH